jgi:PEP-CTERM motif
MLALEKILNANAVHPLAPPGGDERTSIMNKILLLAIGCVTGLTSQAFATSLDAEHSFHYVETTKDQKSFDYSFTDYKTTQDHKSSQGYRSSSNDKSSYGDKKDYESKPTYGDKSSDDYEKEKDKHKKPYPGHHYPPKNVPEPSTVVLLGLGFLVAGWFIRRIKMQRSNH